MGAICRKPQQTGKEIVNPGDISTGASVIDKDKYILKVAPPEAEKK